MNETLTCENCGNITPRNNNTQRRCTGCAKEQTKINTRRYRENNPEYNKRWQESHFENLLLHKARWRAKSKDVPFDIEVSDIVIPAVCPILGIPLVVGRGKVHAGSPSLDRVVPELGYTRDNIQVISYRANSIKLGEWALSKMQEE